MTDGLEKNNGEWIGKVEIGAMEMNCSQWVKHVWPYPDLPHALKRNYSQLLVLNRGALIYVSAVPSVASNEDKL